MRSNKGSLQGLERLGIPGVEGLAKLSKNRVGFSRRVLAGVLHFRSLEKYTPRSFSVLISSSVSLEPVSADIMVNLREVQKLFILFLRTMNLHFWTYVPGICPGREQVYVRL